MYFSHFWVTSILWTSLEVGFVFFFFKFSLGVQKREETWMQTVDDLEGINYLIDKKYLGEMVCIWTITISFYPLHNWTCTCVGDSCQRTTPQSHRCVLSHAVIPTLSDPVHCSLPGSSVHGYSPAKNTGVGCHALLQGIFPTQGSNPGLPHCRQIPYRLSHQGSSSHRGILMYLLIWLTILIKN